MTFSIKNTLLISLFTFPFVMGVNASELISIDESATSADEILEQYESLAEDMSADRQLEAIENQLKDEELDLLQPICREYRVDLNTGDEVCVEQ
ncbi:hypothetical protein EKG38_00915 [Shewanella canadensis]|uniref:Uncharacterized protein n=1 Tax=Shewanella canadensis TaxID=271096 RepID=A0A3S0IQF2_9GAMM|nr:hypothetical protein [Shewanella canadensis]RTR40516.1 hypothetical protein EKG38_00915 [Shewanella canadensis]